MPRQSAEQQSSNSADTGENASFNSGHRDLSQLSLLFTSGSETMILRLSMAPKKRSVVDASWLNSPNRSFRHRLLSEIAISEFKVLETRQGCPFLMLSKSINLRAAILRRCSRPTQETASCQVHSVASTAALSRCATLHRFCLPQHPVLAPRTRGKSFDS